MYCSFPRLSVSFFSLQPISIHSPGPQPWPHPVPKDVQMTILGILDLEGSSAQAAKVLLMHPCAGPHRALFLFHCGRPVSESTGASARKGLACWSAVALERFPAIFPISTHRGVHLTLLPEPLDTRALRSISRRWSGESTCLLR